MVKEPQIQLESSINTGISTNMDMDTDTGIRIKRKYKRHKRRTSFSHTPILNRKPINSPNSKFNKIQYEIVRDFDKIKTFENIRKYTHNFIFIGEGTHKIKKKAEQLACLDALTKIEKYEGNKRNMTV